VHLRVGGPVVDEDLLRQRGRGGRAEPADAAVDLVAGAEAADGLALLADDRVGELFLVRLYIVGDPVQVADALLVGQRGPGRLGRGRLVDGRLNVGGGAERVPADDLAGRGVLDLGVPGCRADAVEQGLTSLHPSLHPSLPANVVVSL
jgi:hypothetical protein